MNISCLAQNGGFVTQSLREPQGNRSGLVAALFTMLLLIAGCGGGSSNTATPAPTFSPAPGAYAGTQNVTVSDTNQSAVLYCTNDGSAPTASSQQCTNPIKVSQSQTLSAVAMVPGKSASAVATAAYIITASASAPTVSGIGPASGSTAGGTSVTVIGTNFTSAASVNFGTTAATSVTVNSATSLTAVSPAGTGSVHVTVVTSAGRSATSTADLFTYSATVSAPAITGISPNAVPTGDAGFTLTVNGTNFVPGATVLWNNTAGATSSVSSAGLLRNIAFSRGNSSARAEAASSSTALTTTFVSSTELQAAVPASLVASAGAIIVAVENPDGSSSGSTPTGSTFAVGAPAIASIFPASVASGSAGFALAVNGTDFASGSTVLWGNTTLVTTLVSSTQLIAAVPSSLLTTAGTATVTVTDSAGTSSGATFTIANSAPVITSLSTASGTVGTSVTISGSNFGSSQGTSTLTFGGVAATVTSWNPGALVTTVPTGAITGNVVVTVNNVASNGLLFTMTPSISQLSSTSGGVGTSVTITGANFGSSPGTVAFNGTPATVTNWNNSSITTVVPTGATSGNVVVTVNGIASNGSQFTVYPQPVIRDLSPAAGAVGVSVTITGTNFGSSQGASTVVFNGIQATVTSWGASSIVAKVPTGATSGDLVVTVNGISSNGFSFTVYPQPTISGLSPSSGAVGAVVTITGTNFGSTQGTSTVIFNKTPASAISASNWSDTQIVATVPTGASTGYVVVTVNGVASAGVQFTVPGSPDIKSLNPPYGLPGSSVAIKGENLGTTQGTVSFNGTSATITSWNAGEIDVTVPASATTGNVSVTASGVTTNDLVFTITPTITVLKPNSGPVGTAVEIDGSSFGSSQGGSTVTFSGGTTAASITSWNDTTIMTTVPAGASGTGNVVVTVNGAPSVSSAASLFTVPPPPAITSLSPAVTAGGGVDLPLTLVGTDFDSSAVVNWGSTTLTPTSITPTQITVTVPAAQIAKDGPVDVTVTQESGTSNSKIFTVATFISGTVVSGPNNGSGVGILATVQLYAAGTSGYGVGSQALGSPVQSNTNTGVFQAIEIDCSTLTAPNDQLYLVATGTTNTNAVLMTALGSCSNIATAYPNGVTINEATTTASAFALAGFAHLDATTGYGINIGAPTSGPSCTATNTDKDGNLRPWLSTGDSTCNYIGLKNAFATVPNLVDIPSGQALAVTPAYCATAPGVPCTTATAANTTLYYATSIVPQGRINAMANALAACANPTSTNCSTLFAATEIEASTYLDGNSSPTFCAQANLNTPSNTLQAALNIAHFPGDRADTACGVDIASGVGIYSLIPASNPPYAQTLTASTAGTLQDLSLALIFQGGGLGGPYNNTLGVNGTPEATGVAIDAGGNIWVPTISSTGGSLVVLNNQGAPISANGNSSTNYGGYTTGIYNPLSIAIDQNGNAWIGNSPAGGLHGRSANGSLSEVQLSGSSLSTLQNETNGGATTLLTPAQYGLAIDASNNVWLSSNPGVGGIIQNGCQSGTYGGSILEFQNSDASLLNGANGGDLSYTDNSSCPTTLAFDESGWMWTWDNGVSGKDDPSAGSIVQLTPSSGGVTGGPYKSKLKNPSYEGSDYCSIGSLPTANANMAIDSLGDSWFAGDSGFACMFVIPNMATSGASTAIRQGTWGWALYPASDSINTRGPTVIDGGDNAWATEDFGYLIGYSSENSSISYNTNATDASVLSPQNNTFGFFATDPSVNASGRTNGTNALSSANNGTGLGVDGSGNLWVSGEALGASAGPFGTQLTEFIGLAVPAQTPLATALTNDTAMTAKGQGGQGQRP